MSAARPSRSIAVTQAGELEAAFRAFARASGLFHNAMEPYFAKFGLTGAQWGVLRALRRAEDAGERDGLRLAELGRKLLVRPPSVTSVIDRLEIMGMVERRADTTDLRGKRVALTAQGRAALERVLPHHPAQMQWVLGGLSAAEIRQLLKLMLKLAGHLDPVGPEVGPTGSLGARKRDEGTGLGRTTGGGKGKVKRTRGQGRPPGIDSAADSPRGSST